MTQQQTIDIVALAGLLDERPAALAELVTPLSAEEAAALVDFLKAEADRHWWINANRSLELAGVIERVGRARGDGWQIALGTMARGDALKLLGRTEEAWDALGRAGKLFEQCGDSVGWARTRIGRLVICVELSRVDEALADAELARDILARAGQRERLFSLYNNIAMVHGYLGDQRRALEIYQTARALVEDLGPAGERNMSLLLINMGYAHHMLGDFARASHHYQRARALFEARGEIRGVALAEHNMAHVAMSQGQHRRALELLLQARDRYAAERLDLDANHVGCDMVESYLLLNRYADARDLAVRVIDVYRAAESEYSEGIALLHLATAEAHLGELEAARAALDRAQQLFERLGAASWLELARLRSGQIAMRLGDLATAREIAAAAAEAFKACGARVEYGRAALLHAQALLHAGDWLAARASGEQALEVARRCNIPPLRYSAHLLAGQIAEVAGEPNRAARRYAAAMATIDRVQRGLTITLRPDFLDDKGDALRMLMRLLLRSNQAARAFETLERAKSQVLLGYLANRERLRWAESDARSRPLLEELNRLREEHQWFYRLAHDPPVGDDGQRPAIASEQALAELAARERRMRAIAERLYLYGGDDRAAGVVVPRLAEIQRQIDDRTLLIEFYDDGTDMWAFALDAAGIAVERLPIAVAEVGRLLAQLQMNVDFALNAGPGAPSIGGLANVARRVLQRLHAGLLASLAGRLAGRERVVVVPYGALHYLPFHLLHDGASYLIERAEVVVLPAAGLATRRAPSRGLGARVLAYSWDGRLTQTEAEARLVQRLFGGEVFVEQAARRAVLAAAPTQILHVATHGEHRLDQPDLSFVQLADGQLYADDLLQHDLSYELVTLGACETGRANLAAGDELIGLGRGLLYAGAGALVTSLWRVADDAALDFMRRLYGSLRAGDSKAAAMRGAQLAVLRDSPRLHPAFWGAFQLVGNPEPLSRRGIGPHPLPPSPII